MAGMGREYCWGGAVQSSRDLRMSHAAHPTFFGGHDRVALACQKGRRCRGWPGRSGSAGWEFRALRPPPRAPVAEAGQRLWRYGRP